MADFRLETYRAARRRLLRLGLGCSLLPLGFGNGLAKETGPACRGEWPAWSDFVSTLVQSDGRVVDLITADRRTTSEAQGYAMFFALVNNDAALFAQLWNWVSANLLTPRNYGLPAWLWGLGSGAINQVLDSNSASDADLWIAYSLLEAGRLWGRRDFSQSGRAMLLAVSAREMLDVQGLGPMLMPGGQGFTGPGWWRFNPSYVPLQLLRRCAQEMTGHPMWQLAPAQALKLVQLSSPKGFAPDWIRWNGQAMVTDPSTGAVGSWDAIRTYLWAGMLPADDGLRAPLLAALHGPLEMLRKGNGLAEKMDTRRGAGYGIEPRGYAGALLPYLQACGETAALAAQRALIPPVNQYRITGLPYYERILVLFGCGFQEGRFHFEASGRLVPAWQNTCGAGA